MKLLLALLALFTGLSVADGVRVAEPSIAEGGGAVPAAFSTAEEAQASIGMAIYLAVAFIPIVLALIPANRWVATPVAHRITTDIYRSDRLRQ